MANNLFLIDLDHTLFDTEALKAHLSTKLLDILESEVLVEKFHATEKSYRKQPNYFQKFLQGFSVSEKLSSVQQSALQQLLLDSDFSEFIFNDSLEAVTQLNNFGECWLFSTGDPLLQKAKIQHHPVWQHFSQIHIFDNKLDHLPEVYTAQKPDHQIWFIDNYLEYLAVAYGHDNGLKTVFVNRYNFTSNVQFQPTKEVTSLREFGEYIHTLSH